MSLAVRTKSEPEALTAGVRGAILSIDKNQPAHDIKTMGDVLSASVANSRIAAANRSRVAGLLHSRQTSDES